MPWSVHRRPKSPLHFTCASVVAPWGAIWASFTSPLPFLRSHWPCQMLSPDAEEISSLRWQSIPRVQVEVRRITSSLTSPTLHHLGNEAGVLLWSPQFFMKKSTPRFWSSRGSPKAHGHSRPCVEQSPLCEEGTEPRVNLQNSILIQNFWALLPCYLPITYLSSIYLPKMYFQLRILPFSQSPIFLIKNNSFQAWQRYKHTWKKLG